MPSVRRPASAPVKAFAVLPDPGQAATIDDLVERLRSLKVWAGDPSYAWITSQVNEAWTAAGRPAGELAGTTTVKDCFRHGRRRLNADLMLAVVQALHPDLAYVTQWRQALRVASGETRAAAQVRVQDTLPRDLIGFTGRTTELDRLRRALQHGQHDGGAAVVATIAGMAGVGKTQLAVRAAHLLVEERPFDRVLFVNLRGFHPDPAQPPADPTAVLEGFLRVLGVPGPRIPHDLPGRVAAYRDRLAGTRTLVVLDNASTVDQVRPLLPETPGCPVLVTSRRSLARLGPAVHVTVDVFTPDEARVFLTRAVSGIPVGDDPDAASRIAGRCGYLPLALGLVAGHIRGTTGWTLTDHADRLDERHRVRRLDTGVQLALDVSCQHLPVDRQRLLRLVALHPGQDLDAHAAAALADTDLPTIHAHLAQLRDDHLLQEDTPGRYTLHDLVRAYAAARGRDEDPPTRRRAALTRLFDYYLVAAGTAAAALHPAHAQRGPRIPPTGTPALDNPATALAWLDTERATLVTVAGHAATNGWPAHTTQLSTTLYRYLEGGHHADALTVHGSALCAARDLGDPAAQARALNGLGAAHVQLGRHGPAAEHFQQALHLFRQAGDPTGQAHALNNLGVVETRLGRYRPAGDQLRQALALFRQAGDRTGEARALGNLGNVEARLGRDRPASGRHRRAVILCRQAGDRSGEADALNNLGNAEARLGRYGSAAEHLQQALTLFRQAGHRSGEVWVRDSLGILHTRLGQPVRATAHHRQALVICRETGDRDGEVWTLNGLGEAARAAGRPADAVSYHTAAHALAVDIGAPDEQARAHTGLGHAQHTLGDPAGARQHYRHAVTLYTHLGMPQAERIRAHLTASSDNSPERGRELLLDAPPASTGHG
jgi:tetratricopeptide (TPR) repeat protein